MFILDTDTLTLLLLGQASVAARRIQATEEVAITVITRIEVLQGRFASVLKAEDGRKLLLAQQRLAESERDLAHFLVLSVDAGSVTQFDGLRQNKKLKKIGRADLLIASIALANRATLVSRNLKHFRQVPNLQIEELGQLMKGELLTRWSKHAQLWREQDVSVRARVGYCGSSLT